MNLAGTWRARSAPAHDRTWGWLALLALLGGFVAWSVAAQPASQVLAAINMVGASALLLTTAIGLVLQAGHSLVDLTLNPVIGWSQPLLGVLALTLLVWPRLLKVSPVGRTS